MKFSRLSALLLLTLATGACDDQSMDVDGTFVLTSVNNRPLPARVSCGNFQVAESVLTLEREPLASYTRRLVEEGTGRILTYEADGVYRVEDNTIYVTVSGRWSNISQSFSDQFYFEILTDVTDPAGALVRKNVGSECDASDTEIYLRDGSAQ